jgi:hypothetical protein
MLPMQGKLVRALPLLLFVVFTTRKRVLIKLYDDLNMKRTGLLNSNRGFRHEKSQTAHMNMSFWFHLAHSELELTNIQQPVHASSISYRWSFISQHQFTFCLKLHMQTLAPTR